MTAFDKAWAIVKMRQFKHKKCPDCGASPSSKWIDPGRCECGFVTNPSDHTDIEVRRD